MDTSESNSQSDIQSNMEVVGTDSESDSSQGEPYQDKKFPKLFDQETLNHLVRDLGLDKDRSELLAS